MRSTAAGNTSFRREFRPRRTNGENDRGDNVAGHRCNRARLSFRTRRAREARVRFLLGPNPRRATYQIDPQNPVRPSYTRTIPGRFSVVQPRLMTCARLDYRRTRPSTGFLIFVLKSPSPIFLAHRPVRRKIVVVA